MIEEPVLRAHSIQGNIAPGFSKDHQRFIFLAIDAARLDKVKSFLRDVSAILGTMDLVLAHKNLRKALTLRVGLEPQTIPATWVNVAFSYAGLRILSEDAERFDAAGAFRVGMPARSAGLGDPTGTDNIGAPQNWTVGSPTAIPDILLIVASDRESLLCEEVRRLFRLSPSEDLSVDSVIAECGVRVLAIERGETLPGDLRGHEHFGFKDGISQPGIRGTVDGTYLTDRDITSTSNNDADLYGRPGQSLVWPGEFICGYPREDYTDPRNPVPPVDEDIPPWAVDGSFVVFRKLQQDVPAFNAFVTSTFEKLRKMAGFSTLTVDMLGALLVGRWKSGAPVMRAQFKDNGLLATDDDANNAFSFVADFPATKTVNEDVVAVAGDPAGVVCPHFAHIRKVHPRDVGTEIGPASVHRIMRRGIPYGSVDGQDEERGLLFLCYQRSIERGFESIQKFWANSDRQPDIDGQDVLIGQNAADAQRVRTFTLHAPTGESATVLVQHEFVVPRGGGYFFSPSRDALTTILARAQQAGSVPN